MMTLLLRAPPILWIRQDRHFYFFLLFLLSRKVRNATIKLPKEISKPIIPININTISAAVISRTSLPTYYVRFVLPVNRSLAREATTLSWVLSVIWILLQSHRNFNQILFFIELLTLSKQGIPIAMRVENGHRQKPIPIFTYQFVIHVNSLSALSESWKRDSNPRPLHYE